MSEPTEATEATEATTAGATPAPRRSRRHDPHRRDRLIDAALSLIAERGVAGTTHREIARAADVPLGSMTYHFAGLDEVLVEAFTRHAESMAAVFDRRLVAATDRDEAIEAVITLAFAGLGFATLVPAAMHAADELPGIPHGTGLTIVSWLLWVGFLLSPPLVGFVADLTSLRVGLLTVVVAGVATVFLARVFANRPA
ncbi:TetR family transcriptional regulator [Actinoplanes sp. NPDC051470]|uniref:TetR family transcriptional regulator n=1 Tax=Actinoplanes sp. NPDC051470 TaxID=3157224 RepID=UPI00342E27A5